MWTPNLQGVITTREGEEVLLSIHGQSVDEERENWWLDAYVCVNDVAQGPPALGAQPPERFRQS